MTQFLPPNLLSLFAARDPIPYLPPVDVLPYEKRTAGYTGVGDYVQYFEDPKNTPQPQRFETKEERREAKRKAKSEQVAYKLEQDIALWNPGNNPSATTDPYKTLFVARISYDTSESKLRREFEMYGPIKKIKIIVSSETGKPRGYAFIEYEHVRDMHSAFKHADGRKIDGKRVLVDVERGRSVKGWLPRRLGGGLGGTRRGGPEVNLKHSGREEQRLEERYGERDFSSRPERPERHRSPSRSRRRRSRSRSRDRRRAERRKRDRSRDRGRDRESGIKPDMDGNAEVKLDNDAPSHKERDRRRSRSRDRDRKRRRSRSRDRKEKRDKDRRDRDSHRERNVDEERVRDREREIVKEEPTDPYNNNTGYEEEFNSNYMNNNNNDNNNENTDNIEENNMEEASYEGY